MFYSLHFLCNYNGNFFKYINFTGKTLCSIPDLHICIAWRRSLRNGSASLVKSRFLRPHPRVASSGIGRLSYNIDAKLFTAISKYLTLRACKTEANQEVRNRHLAFHSPVGRSCHDWFLLGSGTVYYFARKRYFLSYWMFACDKYGEPKTVAFEIGTELVWLIRRPWFLDYWSRSDYCRG